MFGIDAAKTFRIEYERPQSVVILVAVRT